MSKPQTLQLAKHQVKEFRAVCITGEGVPIKDTKQNSCEEALRCSRNGHPLAQPVVLSMSVEFGVQLLSTGGKILARYALVEVFFCFISEDKPNTFAFIGTRSGSPFCNAVECSSEGEAKVLHEEMSRLFHLASEISEHENQLKKTRVSSYIGWLPFWKTSARDERPPKRPVSDDDDYEEEKLMGLH